MTSTVRALQRRRFNPAMAEGVTIGHYVRSRIANIIACIKIIVGRVFRPIHESICIVLHPTGTLCSTRHYMSPPSVTQV